MSCYFLAHIKIHDYKEYQRYLAVDEQAERIEGNPDTGRRVLIEFPTEEAFRLWYHSEEYQKILKHRLSAAECSSLLLHGLENEGD